MAQNIGKYESIFIIDPSLTEEATKEIIKKFTDLVEKHATMNSVEEWGKRRLAYEINDHKEGHYVLMNFSASPDFPAELTRIYNITEEIMRSMTIALEQ